MNGSVPVSLQPAADADSDAPMASRAAPTGSLMGYGLLFVPFALAMGVAGAPLLSYLVAWTGSLGILWLTIGGHVRPLPGGVPALEQIMRPIVLTQILFAAYNFLSSAFYVADLHGYFYLTKVSSAPVVPGAMEAAAEAQRYYVLAHAAITAGMLAAMDYRRSGEWTVRPMDNPAQAALVLSVIALGIGTVLGVRDQFGLRFLKFGLVGSVLALGLAIPTRRFWPLVLGLALFVYNLSEAFLSGWKEEVLVMVLLLAVFMYPYARKTVLLGTPIAIIFLLAILPTYANIVRGMSWGGETTAEEAAATAAEELRSGQADVAATNWAFLTGRISEIGLFVQYIDSYDNLEGTSRGFYGGQILGQSLSSLIPRAFWSSKPVTEELVMSRVYEAGVVSANSNVSAKPQYVVDGYLSGGAIGVLLAGLLFGVLASLASRVCERWFGGYFWGTGLVYTSMFAVFWKGNTFEFFFNTVFWSFVLLIPLHWIGKKTGFLIRADALVAEEAEAPGDAVRLRPRPRRWEVA